MYIVYRARCHVDSYTRRPLDNIQLPVTLCPLCQRDRQFMYVMSFAIDEFPDPVLLYREEGCTGNWEGHGLGLVDDRTLCIKVMTSAQEISLWCFVNVSNLPFQAQKSFSWPMRMVAEMQPSNGQATSATGGRHFISLRRCLDGWTVFGEGFSLQKRK